jgi:hypothetical protein
MVCSQWCGWLGRSGCSCFFLEQTLVSKCHDKAKILWYGMNDLLCKICGQLHLHLCVCYKFL